MADEARGEPHPKARPEPVGRVSGQRDRRLAAQPRTAARDPGASRPIRVRADPDTGAIESSRAARGPVRIRREDRRMARAQ